MERKGCISGFMFTILMERIHFRALVHIFLEGMGYIQGSCSQSSWNERNTFQVPCSQSHGKNGIQSRVHVHVQGKDRIHFRVTFITFTILMEEMGYILAFMFTII
jgi:hypothetical protein